MKVVEINSGFRGSTGTIMLGIADLVCSCGGEAYTFAFNNANYNNQYVVTNVLK